MNNAFFQDKFTANHFLLELLQQATEGERLQLTRILEGDDKSPYEVNKPYETEKLCREITIAGGNSFANTARKQGNSYWDILDDVAKLVLKKGEFNRYSSVEAYDHSDFFEFSVKRKAKNYYIQNNNLELTEAERNILHEKLDQHPDKYGNYIANSELEYKNYLNQHCLTIEELIVVKVLEISYSKMNQEEKNEFDQKVSEIAIEQGITSGKLSKGVAGLILIGEMGGFTTYMLMSIFLSKLGLGAMGFSVFTGASSLLGVILGPVGWIASGSWLVWEIASPSKNKMAKIVVTIALIRMRLNEEEIKRKSNKTLTVPKTFIDRMQCIFTPRELPQYSYQNLRNKKNKKGRKKF